MNHSYSPRTVNINLQERNNKALALFTRNGFTVRWLGNEESPMFILDDEYLLSCHVNGNNLYFRTSPESGEILRTVRLTGDTFLTKYELEEILSRSSHLPVYRIQDESSGMYLIGYDFLKNEDNERMGRYPVFAKHNPIVYVSKSKAYSVIEELERSGYRVHMTAAS